MNTFWVEETIKAGSFAKVEDGKVIKLDGHYPRTFQKGDRFVASTLPKGSLACISKYNSDLIRYVG